MTRGELRVPVPGSWFLVLGSSSELLCGGTWNQEPGASHSPYSGNLMIMFANGISRWRRWGVALREHPLSIPVQVPRTSNDSWTYGIPSAPSGELASARWK